MEQDKINWLKERQKGIGGSDVGSIMGMNKWKSAFQVYIEKTEEITNVSEQSEAAYFGTILEDTVAREFSRRTGKKVRKDNRHLVHNQHSFIVANIDRRIVGENAILECKTCSSYGTSEWEGEDIPGSYLLQCQHYMAVTEADKCYIAVLIGNQKFVIKEILRDEELINMIIDSEIKFWNEHVLKGVPPILDGSDAASKYLKERFDKANSDIEKPLKSEYQDEIDRYLNIKGQVKALDEEMKSIENNLKLELGEAEKGSIAKYLVLWKQVISNRIDSAILKANYPTIYKEVCKESKSRRFSIKEVLE